MLEKETYMSFGCLWEEEAEKENRLVWVSLGKKLKQENNIGCGCLWEEEVGKKVVWGIYVWEEEAEIEK